MPQFDFGDSKKVASATLDELNDALANCSELSQLKNVAKELSKVVDAVSEVYVNRRETVELVLASLVSGVPMVLMGEPGLAKSAIVNKVVDVCGGSREKGDYFEYLLTNHTMPENIYGPPDLGELKKGHIRTNTEKMLPTASVAFLDEVFRGSPAILNTLLSVINERKFFNGRSTDDVPLIGVIGAANDLTSNPELTAFVDRFPVRHWMESVLNDSNEKTPKLLMEKSLKANMSSATPTSPKSSLNALRACRVYVDRVAADQISQDGFNTYYNAFRLMRTRNDYALSDRSFSAIFRMGCAFDIVRYGEPREYGPTELLKHVALDKDKVKHSTDIIEKLLSGRGVGSTV